MDESLVETKNSGSSRPCPSPLRPLFHKRSNPSAPWSSKAKLTSLMVWCLSPFLLPKCSLHPGDVPISTHLEKREQPRNEDFAHSPKYLFRKGKESGKMQHMLVSVVFVNSPTLLFRKAGNGSSMVPGLSIPRIRCSTTIRALSCTDMYNSKTVTMLRTWCLSTCPIPLSKKRS
jgi:hypothetical protein